jgi:hypothetical protein
LGTFALLPEGAVFLASNNQTFRINYAGGDGNDVVLTRVLIGISVSGIAISPRNYDGTPSAPLDMAHVGLSGLIAGDSTTALVVSAASGTYADASAGAGKLVTVTGLMLTGPLADNYEIVLPQLSGTIEKAAAPISVPGFIGHYDGQPHMASGTATGVNQETLAGLDLAATIHTAAGFYSDTWTFTDPTGNYQFASGSVTRALSGCPA